jgi:hypothetical protein
MVLSSRFASKVFVVVLLFGALAGGLTAGPRRSLSDLDIETAEARLTLDRVLAENARLKEETQRLQEKLTIAEASGSRMTESLALANSEAEVFRRRSGELKLRLEALGVEGGTGAANKLEQRLLAATSDWRLAEQERTKFLETLKALLESVQRFASKAISPDTEARILLEAQVRKTQEVLASSNQVPGAVNATLADGQVINFSEELALVVANIGSKQGVITGMPFQVFRDNRLVGTIRVVDVREKIAGAVIENLSSEKERIQIGDRVKVAARQ